jgi:hypothetical protein
MPHQRATRTNHFEPFMQIVFVFKSGMTQGISLSIWYEEA